MRKISGEIILLFVGMCFLNDSFASTSSTDKEQSIEYQKEADKYKKLYEKYQKLADKSNEAKPSKEAVATAKTTEATEAKPQDSQTWEVIKDPWKGSDFGVGGTIATGDSATTNVNALIDIDYQPIERWNNKLFFNYVYSTNNSGKSRRVKVNKFQARAETAWDFTKANGIYGRMSYLNDELSTYDFIFTESVGYKRRVYENKDKSMYLDVSAGPSFLQSRVTNGQFQANEPGFQATLDYAWKFTDKSNFKQNILYNYDQKNRSIYQSISAVSVEVYKNFKLQLSFQLNGTTLVTPGKSNINTITSTNIMYTL